MILTRMALLSIQLGVILTLGAINFFNLRSIKHEVREFKENMEDYIQTQTYVNQDLDIRDPIVIELESRR